MTGRRGASRHLVPLHRALQVSGGQDADTQGKETQAAGWEGGGGWGPGQVPGCSTGRLGLEQKWAIPEASLSGTARPQPQEVHKSRGCASRLPRPLDPAQQHGSARAALWLERGQPGGHRWPRGMAGDMPLGAPRGREGTCRRQRETQFSVLMCARGPSAAGPTLSGLRAQACVTEPVWVTTARLQPLSAHGSASAP